MRVALRATDVASSDDVDAAAVFDMAGGAVGHIGADLVFVVNGAVVAGETRDVGRFGRKFAGFLDVARGALLVQDGVRSAHVTARIDARVAGEPAPGDPANSQKWAEYDQRQARPFERSGALEIVQVNALRDRFGCPCSGQWLPAVL